MEDTDIEVLRIVFRIRPDTCYGFGNISADQIDASVPTFIVTSNRYDLVIFNTDAKFRFRPAVDFPAYLFIVLIWKLR